jgi:integrase/recombinase XerD
MPYQYKREPLSDDEVNRLTNACETFDEKFVIWTLLYTGLRVSEFAHLKKDNILWQERRLVIYGKGGPYGKKTKRRILPMTDRVRRLIEYHFAEHNGTGMTVRTAQRIFKQVANKAGISKLVTPHVLRHKFSVNCIKKGISSRALMALLGHDRLTTTEIYLNLSPEDAIREFQNKW